MLLKSFSKINLTLNVTKKQKNGLHDIQSYYCLIDLHDKIRISINNKKKDNIKFKGRFSRFIDKKKNSVNKTLNILRKKKLISKYYSIVIKKEIPVFAGLGGGTSNAAFIAKYLLENKDFSKSVIKTLEHQIGSDFRLFFYNQGYVSNLKTIINIEKKHKLYFLLVFPRIKCSTRLIYSKINKYSKKANYQLQKTKNKTKFLNLIKNKKNDLQSVVEKKHPIIKKIIREIEQKKGCHFSRMTGSGSVCYAVFSSEKTAKTTLKNVKRKFPYLWLSFAKTV